ncbi:MAG: hypothetical protein IJ069_03790 [Prevotella sp.]|nr:hypothetical protein [Prevotella sp.]
MKKVKFLMVTLLLIMSSMADAQSTKAQFRAVLDQFCQSYYESAFGGKQYIEGSLSVLTLESDEVNEVIHVKGKHSYRGQYIPFFGRQTHSNVDYKADISVTDSGINIKFWKWYEADMRASGHWEGPCEKTIIP